MDAGAEKVYVAVGNDVEDGLKTLDWTLKKWTFHPISIIIIHVTEYIRNDRVYMPLGKMPAKLANDRIVKDLERRAQEKIDKLLTKYISFCGQAEILEVKKYDKPIYKLIIDLIFGLGISKLVVGFSFMKPFSKPRVVTSGLFLLHQHMPDFCELFIIYGGKQVFIRCNNNDEKIMEDENGVVIEKIRDGITFRGLVEVFTERLIGTPDRSPRTPPASTNSESPDSQIDWEFYLLEIEHYYQEMSSLNLEEGCDLIDLQISLKDPDVSGMSTEEITEILRHKLKEAKETIQSKRKETEVNFERHDKAEWIISLCNCRAEEMEASKKEEARIRQELERELHAKKEEVDKILSCVEESKQGLSSILRLKSELSTKLTDSACAKSRAQLELDMLLDKREEMAREIEELRQQRDVLHRRIQFCRGKDAIIRVSEDSCSLRKYTLEEIWLATSNFAEGLRLKSGGDWTNVYRGRIDHSTVAIKIFNEVNGLSQEDFLVKVKLLCRVRHPYLVAVVGFCLELKCVVFEYMHNGSLRDLLFSSRGERKQALQWYDRIRIAAEVCSGLGFLHAAKPRPITHNHLTASNVLLDWNMVAKLGGFRLNPNDCHDGCSIESDILALGKLMMNLLTGRDWVGQVEEAKKMDREALTQVLDYLAGQWPLDLAEEMAALATRCMSINSEQNNRVLMIAEVMKELGEIRRKANDRVATEMANFRRADTEKEGSSDVPRVFLCPISKKIMKNPHVAADGYSYELEAIEKRLQSRC